MLTQEYDEAATMELFREEGRREGLEEGLERGREEGSIRSLIGLVRDGLLTADVAAARAPIPADEFYARMRQ